MTITESAIGALTVRQQMLQVGWRPTRQYDYSIIALSWEERSTTAVFAIGEPLTNLSVLKFASITPEIEQKKQENLARISSHSQVSEVVDLAKSIETDSNFTLLEQWLKQKYAAKKRPLRLLIDITCLPKSYLLFLLGLGFSRDYVARFDCLYAPGKYDLAAGAQDQPTGPIEIGGPRSLISLGEWRSVSIPYLEASEFMPSTTDLFVTLGGEVGLSAPFIEKAEPESLELVFIKESGPSSGNQMLESERTAYEQLMDSSKANASSYGLCDVVGVAKRAVAFSREGRSATTSAMAVGCKPHAMALAIAALSEEKIGVLARVPSSYSTIDVPPSGEVLLVEIEDRFDPSAYF